MTRNAPIATRNEVARAVRSALITYGYADLRTAHIADASSKSEASLYYYYETKSELIAVFVRRAPTWIDERIKEIDATNPDERLRKICDCLLFADDDDQLCGMRIAILELLSHAAHNPVLQEPLENYQNHLRELLATEIQAAINDGIYRQNIDPQGTASFLLTILNGSTASVLALKMQGVRGEVRVEMGRYLDWLSLNNQNYNIDKIS